MNRWNHGGAALGVCALSLVAITGCATIDVVPPSSTQLDALRGSSLTTVTYRKADFAAMTADKMAAGALFGAIGGAVAGASMVKAGNQIVESNAVPDPADEIAFTLTPLVARRLAPAGFAALPGLDPSGDSVSALSSTAAKRGIVFDVKTVNWMLGYFPSDWSRYRVTYVARARLIDAASGKLVGQVPCTYVSDDSNTAPTYDELLADGATLLKSKLRTATAKCAELISQNLLGVAGVSEADFFEAPIPVAADAPPIPQEAFEARHAPIAAPLPAAGAADLAPLSAAPSAGQRPAAIVVGGQIALGSIARLRNAPTPTSAVSSEINPGTSVVVDARVANASGVWLYLVSADDRGWILEAELAAP